MMLAHLAALDGAPARDFWLFDTFAGMSEPSAEDGAFANERFAMIANRTFTKASSLGGVRDHKWTFGGTLREVARNVAHTGYPCDRVHLVQGKVEDSTRSRAVPLPKRIALLRIDTDWYNSVSRTAPDPHGRRSARTSCVARVVRVVRVVRVTCSIALPAAPARNSGARLQELGYALVWHAEPHRACHSSGACPRADDVRAA